MAKKKISVGTWAYIWGGYADEPIALPVVVEKLQEYKFDGVELGIFAPHLSLDDAADLNKVREVKKLLDDHGLGVSGIAADLGKTPPMLASLPDYLDNVLRHVEICEILGTKKLRTDTIVPPTEIPGGMDYETCFWRTAHAFREASKVTGAHGIDFIWEFDPASSSTSRARSSACATRSATRTSASCSTPAMRTCPRWSVRGRWARRKRCLAASSSSPTC